MTIREHADRTEALLGHRAEEIHRWIDRYFDAEGFADFLRQGYRPGYDPYAHRKHRHCREAVADAKEEFSGQYPDQVIEAVVERHIRDDYDGYFPYREDFEKGDFAEKYHDGELRAEVDDKRYSAADLAAYFRGRHYETMARAARRRSTRFLWRFILPTAVALTLLVGSLFTVIVPVSRENMLDLKKGMIRELTAVAVGALDHYAAHAAAGDMSEIEARREAAEEIRRMRYGDQNKEYYWIIDSKPTMVMHPYRKELEGENLTDYRDREDSAGVYLFREAAELARSEGEGFIEYWWQHWDDPSAVAPKLSYVRYFEAWDWIVGTGIYILDVEEETNLLARRLGLVFGGIAAASMLLLIWVLSSALRVEKRRDEAEEGLREAKERYRALAEASTEGYMLVSGGTALYANPALCRILGRSEEDLLRNGPAGLVPEETDPNHPVKKALRALMAGEAPSGSWSVTVMSDEGDRSDLLLGISRIFLPGSNGYVVSVRRPVTAGERLGFPDPQDRTVDRDSPAAMSISEARDRPELLNRIEIYGGELTRLMNDGSPPAVLRRSVADVYDASLKRFADLALERYDDLEVDVAIVSLGSNARREMTPFSDQDGAIVLKTEEHREQALKIAVEIAEGLHTAGFPRCDGGVMPMNPRWCLSLDEWKNRIQEWITEPTPQVLLEMNIVLDRRFAWGNESLAREFDATITAGLENSKALLAMYSRNAMGYRPPRINKRRPGPIDVKQALKPLEIQLRLLALLHGIRAAGTIERLNSLRSAGVIDERSSRDLAIAFETFWTLRFRKQLAEHRRPIRIDDTVDPSSLSQLERGNLAGCLEVVDDFVRRRAMEADRL